MSRIWKYALLPWMLLVSVLAFTWLKDLDTFPDPPTARIIIWHVPMAMLGMIWFWIGAVFAGRYLFGKRQGDPALELRSVHANEVGLLCTILATVTGAVFAYRQWNTPWNWDPKQVNIVILIVIYLAYFVLRGELSDRQQKARISAVYAMIGAVSSVFLMYLIPNIMASLHPGGQVITGGLDPKWRLVYWMATLGFYGITTWMFQLRLRISLLEERSTIGRGAAAQEEARTEAVRKPRLNPAPGE